MLPTEMFVELLMRTLGGKTGNDGPRKEARREAWQGRGALFGTAPKVRRSTPRLSNSSIVYVCILLKSRAGLSA
jgi:hypothetical protein